MSKFENVMTYYPSPGITPVNKNHYPYVTLLDYEALLKSHKELVAALENLHAMLWGECPSLLDGDSGGSEFFDTEIREALRNARGQEGGK